MSKKCMSVSFKTSCIENTEPTRSIYIVSTFNHFAFVLWHVMCFVRRSIQGYGFKACLRFDWDGSQGWHGDIICKMQVWRA